MKKLIMGIGVGTVAAAAIVLGVVGFWFTSTAFAQGPTPAPNGSAGYGACTNNTAALRLLGMSQQDLLAQRQAGKSLLDIAKAKEVSEDKLVNALMGPVTTMHTYMGQQFNNSTYVDQMTQSMKDWITKDIRETKFGTMTDYRLGLGGNGGPGYGMMDGQGYSGMMGGQYNPPAGYGGMMGGQYTPSAGYGGMMGGWR